VKLLSSIPDKEHDAMAMSSDRNGAVGRAHVPAEVTDRHRPKSFSIDADRRLRICIVSNGLIGPVRNGGISTHYMGLAETLVDSGHDVTYLYTGGSWTESEPVHVWVKRYQRPRFNVVPLPESEIRIDNSAILRISYLTYEWLRKHDEFDVIHFHEWHGNGYYSLLAKRHGIAFEKTTLCVGTHSPTSWNKQGNYEFMDRVVDYETDYLERQSVALADELISPSQYMLDWISSEGWRLAPSCRVIPNVLPASGKAHLDSRSLTQIPRDGKRKIEEIVFFGRLEGRKGLKLFCDALDGLASSDVGPFRVSFLGKDGTIEGRSGLEYIDRRSSDWTFDCELITTFGNVQAVDYLRQPGRVAVMPSLMENSPMALHECLLARIPFLASLVGGIPEMVKAEDRPDVLFPLRADALTQRLKRVLREGLSPARPAFDEAANRDAWIDWHQRLPGRSSRAAQPKSVPKATPLVSVCITHFNRKHYLAQALASIRAQDYPCFEVIVVDDGSTHPEAIAFLDAIEPEFSSRAWRIVRQENRFPGAARNNAARQARGEYLLFMDDDNIAKPHEISRFVQAALSSGADILTCFADVFGASEELMAGKRPDMRWLYMGDCIAVGAFYNCFGDTNALIRRDIFLAIGGFTEDYGSGHEDQELYARAILQGYQLEVVPEALYWYRQHPSGVNLRTPPYLNAMRALRPYRDAMPAALQPLLTYAYAHYQWLSRQATPDAGAAQNTPINWPLRYRIVDKINLHIKRIALLHRLFRASFLSIGALHRRVKRPLKQLRKQVIVSLRNSSRTGRTSLGALEGKRPHLRPRPANLLAADQTHEPAREPKCS